MNVICPQCRNEIPADDLNMSHMAAKCTSCDSLFNFADQVNSTFGETSSSASLDAPQPEKVKRDHDGFNLTLSWKWFSYVVFFLIPFALFWNGIVFSFVSFSGIFALSDVDGFPGIFGLFPLFIMPHFLIGIGLIYYILCLFFNQTKVSVSRSEVSVQHGPLPWWGSKTVAAQQIDQLYTKESIRRGKNSTNATYEVHIIDRQNLHKKLLSGLSSSEHAFYIEQEIERYLDIQDRHVRGAYT